MAYELAAADFALALKLYQLPSERETIMPNRPRLHAQIHSEPPSVPRYSYHWASGTVLSKCVSEYQPRPGNLRHGQIIFLPRNPQHSQENVWQ